MIPNIKSPGAEASSSRAGIIQIGLPFLLVLYLAFAGGGYDAIVYGRVGILCWTLLLIGLILGVLPIARVGRAAMLTFSLLAALTVWTAIGISWSESSERSVIELARVASFLGVFALAIAIQGADAVRRSVLGVGSAIAVVALFSLMSRFHPELFPEIEAARYLDDVEARLSYPLNYWNALAALMAIGIPLLLSIATTARARAAQAVAAGMVPVLVLTSFFTLSRGGLLEVAVAFTAFVALRPQRLAALPLILLTTLGSVVLVAVATTRNALEDGLNSSAAISEGNEMLALTIVVCTLVAVGHALAGRALERRERPLPQLSRRAGLAVLAGLAAAAVVVAIGIGAPGKIGDRLDEFTQAEAPDPTAGASRYESLSGNGRYQLWRSAVAANETSRLTGIGPGTFEYWWTQDRPIDCYSRSAHSLYLNALAEIGIVGMLLTIALVLACIGVGIVRWSRAGPARTAYAGAIAGMVTFAVGAGVDRAWDLAVLPVAFFLLAAAALGSRQPSSDGESTGESTGAPALARLGLGGAALVAILAISVPTASLLAIQSSQEDVRDGDLDGALEQARKAGDIQPFAATPLYQEAQVLELRGELDEAAISARAATEKESTNWRTWFVLARIEGERGDGKAATAALDRARELNPLSDLLR